MEKEKLLYLPYRTHYYFALVFVRISFAFSVGIGYSLSNPEWILLIPILFVVATLVFAKHLYDTSKITVLLVAEGLWVVGNGKMAAKYYAWCDIPYLAYARSKRGHQFIVLSSKDLSKSQLEQCVAQGVNSSALGLKPSIIVLPIDPLQDTTLLLDFLNDKVANTKML